MQSRLILFVAFIAAVALLGDGIPAQDKYKSGATPGYQDIRYKTDLEFAEMLDRPWMKVKMLPGLQADSHPKPVHPPTAQISDDDRARLEEALRRSRPVTPPLPPAPPPPPPEPPPPARPEAVSLSFSYFGTPVEIECDPSLTVPAVPQPDNRAISRFWQNAARADFRVFLERAAYYRRVLHLNDWGYALLLYDAGMEIGDGSGNGAVLFAWFALVKSGYDARVGYDESRVYLLLPSVQNWYEVPYFPIDGKSYYVALPAAAKPEGTVYIHPERYPDAALQLDVRLLQSPAVKEVPERRTLRFREGGENYTITVRYNASLMDYFARYPLTDLEVYFDAAMAGDVYGSLEEGLKPLIEDKTEAEAVNFLLHFVQSAFAYETDGEQFGREKYFFAEETFRYPYCDCEDRAVLLAQLVRKLIGLDVIGLDYPGHVAVGVRFSDELPGDDVIYNGQRYIICDPTYIGADIGMCMPQVQGIKPTIIPVST